MKLDFPYVENSLSGIFANLIRKTNLFKYNASVYPGRSDYPVANCFDGSADTFCHSKAEGDFNEHYIQVQFIDFKFKLEGFGFRNRADGFWNPLNYELQASNNGINFIKINSYNENSNTVCTAGKVRTTKEITYRYFSYFRFAMNGETCSSRSAAFNIAELELFGSLMDRECIVSIKKKQVVSFTYFIVPFIVNSFF